MKIKYFAPDTLFITIVLAIFSCEIAAVEQPSNVLTSSGKSIRLDYWQIVKDEDPEEPLPNIKDSLWQIIDSNTDEDLISAGNWILRTTIEIKDSLNDRILLGMFPINLVSAYELYWDGVRLAENGKIGKNNTEEKAGAFNFSLPLLPHLVKKGKHTVTLRISNHNNYSSWKWFYGDIIIGKYDSLTVKISRLHYQAFFIMGILFIPFLFNLFLFIARKRKIEHLLFSLICLIVILDSLTSLIPALIDTRTTYIYWQSYIYQVITVLFTILFPVFFIYLFSLPKSLIGVVILINLVIYLFFTNLANVFDIMPLTVLIISSVITTWAIYKRREESIIIFAGIIAAWAAYIFNLAFAGLASTMVICTSFSIARQFARKENAEREAQLKSARLENELLKKNINPHFVLNTLTSVIVWLRKDTSSAIKLIESLAEEFRMINQMSALKEIPIHQELDLCRAHLRIMSFRKGADYKLDTIDIDEHDTIPPMIFHTLIENGLTHGYDTKLTGLFKLRRIRDSNIVKYTLSNDGEFNTKDSKGSTGFGARYIQGRLEESYPSRWKFRSNKTEEGWESIIEIKDK